MLYLTDSKIKLNFERSIDAIDKNISQLGKSIEEIKDINKNITKINRGDFGVIKNHNLYELRYEKNEKLKDDIKELNKEILKANDSAHKVDSSNLSESIKSNVRETWSKKWSDWLELKGKQKNLDNGFFNKAIETDPVGIHIETSGLLVNYMNYFNTQESSMNSVSIQLNNKVNLLTAPISMVDNL